MLIVCKENTATYVLRILCKSFWNNLPKTTVAANSYIRSTQYVQNDGGKVSSVHRSKAQMYFTQSRFHNFDHDRPGESRVLHYITEAISLQHRRQFRENIHDLNT
jgi:hypothetical protein